MGTKSSTTSRQVKVLVIGGASGYLGRLLYENLSKVQLDSCVDVDVRVTTRAPLSRDHELHLDLLDPASIDSTIAAFTPDVVINTAAISQPGKCEADEEAAIDTNNPSRLVAALEKSPGTLLVHISTDQVFDGTTGNNSEHAPVNPINAYGRSKLLAERSIRAATCSHVILRSSIIVGPEVPGADRPLFVQFILNQLQGKIATSYLSDEWRCPVYVGDICQLIRWFILEHVKRKDTCQQSTTFCHTFNMGGPDRLSRLDMALAVAAVAGVDEKDAHDLILPCKSAELNRPYKSPQDISMDSTAVYGITGVKPTPFDAMIRMIDLIPRSEL